MAKKGFKKKGCTRYLPLNALFSTVVMAAGIITWAIGTNRALEDMDDAAQQLSISTDADKGLKFIKTGSLVIVAFLGVFTAILFAFSMFRSCLEQSVDATGETGCGSVMWMFFYSIAIFFWWLLTILLVVVLMINLLWFAGVRGTQALVDDTISMQYNASSMPANMTLPPGVSLPPGMSIPGMSSGNSTNSTGCMPGCLNLNTVRSMGIHMSTNTTCLCLLTELNGASDDLHDCSEHVLIAIAGAFVMFVGATLILMNSAAAFARARKEREMILDQASRDSRSPLRI